VTTKKSCPKGQDLNLAFIPPLVRRADTLLSLTQTYVTAYTGRAFRTNTPPSKPNAPHLRNCHSTLSDQPLVSELRNAFGRSARTFPLLSDDLIADLLSQSTGYVYIIARGNEKIKPFLKFFSDLLLRPNIQSSDRKYVHLYKVCVSVQQNRREMTLMQYNEKAEVRNHEEMFCSIFRTYHAHRLSGTYQTRRYRAHS